MAKIFQHINNKKLWLLADQTVVSGSNFLLGVLLVRLLDLESYGTYALLWMAVLFGLSINHAFISKPLLSLAPKMNKIAQQQYINSLLGMQSLLALLALVIGAVFYLIESYFNSQIISLAFIPVLTGIVACQLLHDFFRKTFFLQDKIVVTLGIDTLLYIGQLIAIGILGFLKVLTLQNVLYSILAANMLALVFAPSFIPFFKTPKHLFIQHFRKQWSYSKWLIGTAILQWFSGNYFLIVGAVVIGPVALGAIRMVQNIMGVLHIFFLTIENSVPIQMAQQYALGSWPKMLQYLKKNFLKISGLIALLLLSIALAAPYILKGLYGIKYMDYSYIVWVYCGLYCLVFVALPLQFVLRTIEKTHPLFIAYVLSTLFSFGAATPLVEQWRIGGVLAGLVLTQLITCVTYLIFCWNYYKTRLPFKPNIAQPKGYATNPSL